MMDARKPTKQCVMQESNPLLEGMQAVIPDTIDCLVRADQPVEEIHCPNPIPRSFQNKSTEPSIKIKITNWKEWLLKLGGEELPNQYFRSFKELYKAIKSQYPEIPSKTTANSFEQAYPYPSQLKKSRPSQNRGGCFAMKVLEFIILSAVLNSPAHGNFDRKSRGRKWPLLVDQECWKSSLSNWLSLKMLHD